MVTFALNIVIVPMQISNSTKRYFGKCPLVLVCDWSSLQWQELLLPPPGPPWPSPLPKPWRSWERWAGPRGTFGIAADQTCSSGSLSLCPWDLMSRWVVELSGERDPPRRLPTLYAGVWGRTKHTHTHSRNTWGGLLRQKQSSRQISKTWTPCSWGKVVIEVRQ